MKLLDAEVRPTGVGTGRARSMNAGGERLVTTMVRGRGRVALTATDVDVDGFVTAAGVHRVWAAVVDTAAGSELEVDLGATRHVTGQVVAMVADAVRGGVFVTIVAAPSIQGQNVAAIRSALGQVTT